MNYRSSKPDPWTQPRPHTDPSLRFKTYGPVQPMPAERVSLFRRLVSLFNWRHIL